MIWGRVNDKLNSYSAFKSVWSLQNALTDKQNNSQAKPKEVEFKQEGETQSVKHEMSAQVIPSKRDWKQWNRH